MASIFRTGQRIWLQTNGIRVAARVQQYDNEGAIVVSPGEGVVLDRGAVLPVGCPTPHGFALYWMQVLTPPNGMGRNAVLRRNPNAGGNFNRRGWRLNVSLAASIRRTGATHFLECRIANLSIEGAFILSAATLAIGDVIDLRIFLPETSPCQLTARVGRLAASGEHAALTGASPGDICGAGVFFLEVPRETRSVLTRYLWRAIREMHSANLRPPRR